MNHLKIKHDEDNYDFFGCFHELTPEKKLWAEVINLAYLDYINFERYQKETLIVVSSTWDQNSPEEVKKIRIRNFENWKRRERLTLEMFLFSDDPELHNSLRGLCEVLFPDSAETTIDYIRTKVKNEAAQQKE